MIDPNSLVKPRWFLQLLFRALPLLIVFVVGAAFFASSSVQVAATRTSLASTASAARVVDAKFWSASLKQEMSFEVYLPPGYDSNPGATFPVLYMLHGLGGDYRDWQNLGLFDAATSLIGHGEILPMIIVTPQGDSGYWVDHAGNGPRYGSYVSTDLVSYIDANYRTHATGTARAIGGMSMGGHGALQLALNNPGEFDIVGAHSVALRTKDQAFDFFGDLAYYQAHDPMSITAKDPFRTRSMSLWIDIGTADPWFARAQQFHQQLQKQGEDHVWHAWSGEHDANYWSAHLNDYLRFYGNAFKTQAAGSQAALAWSMPR